MIVSTAGHIDHGKTTLVKALTGVDTDRLPEEKVRGISIDIGFAYLAAPNGQVMGFVDVPGHERFIHNMLAGMAGIDFALLVVAADDGVMPQTREHLNILGLFDVPAGIVVITKSDRVSPERVLQVRREIEVLLPGTSLAGAPIMAVSALSGFGIPELQAALAEAAAQSSMPHCEGRNLRFVIDRSFSSRGSGTVVTGTVLGGEVAAGDRLYVSPQGLPVRVRGLHKRGLPAEHAAAGERCAINVVGADPSQASRGMWLVAPNAHAPTQRLDALVRMLPGGKRALKHWDQVHFHIGTADVLARLVMTGQVIEPGQSGIVQLALDRPVAAVLGDKFVIRDTSAKQTLGGGSVIDPFAQHPRGQIQERLARLQALQEPGANKAWLRLLDQSTGGVSVQAFRRTFNLTPEVMRGVIQSSQAALPGGDQASAFSAANYQALETKLLTTVRAFHDHSPHAVGMDTDRLIRATFPKLARRVGMSVLRAVAGAGGLQVNGSLVSQPGYVPAPHPGDGKLWQQLAPLYAQWGLQVPLVREVAARSGIQEAQLREFLRHRAQSGEMVRIAPDRFLERDGLAQLAQAVVHLSQEHDHAEFTIAQYRDYAGIGRNLAIDVMEYFDQLGLTQRAGDARVIRCRDDQIAAKLCESASLRRKALYSTNIPRLE